MEEAALVIDARQPIDHAVIAADDFEPNVVDAGIVAEEAVGPEIDFLAPEVDGARQSADVFARLEDLDLHARLGELIGRGDSSRPGADDADSHAILMLPVGPIETILPVKLGIRIGQKQSALPDLPEMNGKLPNYSSPYLTRPRSFCNLCTDAFHPRSNAAHRPWKRFFQ